MLYDFDQLLFEKIQQAFEDATIATEEVDFSFPNNKDYIFIKFRNPVITLAQHRDQNILPIIFNGGLNLSHRCNQFLESLGGMTELSFRWFGVLHQEEKSVKITGFSLRINYLDNKLSSRSHIFEIILRELAKAKLIVSPADYKARILRVLSSEPAHLSSVTSNPGFFKKDTLTYISPIQMDMIEAYIRENIRPTSPAYARENELSINPAYQPIDEIYCPLKINQKKIWLLRADFILALGNKNSNWTCFKETGLHEAIAPELHSYINWDDRYGHPSLALPHNGYDGSVFYGGYLAQRTEVLEVFMFSGRYHRNDLGDHKKKILESYIAYHFQNAFGNQPVVFIEAITFGNGPAALDNFELSIFYSDNPLPDYCAKRLYDRNEIMRTLAHTRTLSRRPSVHNSPSAESANFNHNLSFSFNFKIITGCILAVSGISIIIMAFAISNAASFGITGLSLTTIGVFASLIGFGIFQKGRAQSNIAAVPFSSNSNPLHIV